MKRERLNRAREREMRERGRRTQIMSSNLENAIQEKVRALRIPHLNLSVELQDVDLKIE
jgi:hypothetical protein